MLLCSPCCPQTLHSRLRESCPAPQYAQTLQICMAAGWKWPASGRTLPAAASADKEELQGQRVARSIVCSG